MLHCTHPPLAAAAEEAEAEAEAAAVAAVAAVAAFLDRFLGGIQDVSFAGGPFQWNADEKPPTKLARCAFECVNAEMEQAKQTEPMEYD